jgi:hypothetical protein
MFFVSCGIVGCGHSLRTGVGNGSELQRYAVDDQEAELLALDYDVTITERMVREC